MEILKPVSTRNPQTLLHSITNSITIYRTKNPLNFRTPFFKFFLKPSPILSNFRLHSSRNLIVSAHFDRPTKRRKNHLRRKLIEQQVRQNRTINHDLASIPENPLPKIDDIDNSLSNLRILNDDIDYSESTLDYGKVSDGIDASKSKNVLWNQLESWADQYKADTQFWGIGSNPIFTVFQDSNGKVEKVDVNEDEILRRIQINPSMYNLKEVDHVKQVQDKISHAKFLAKEMEIGKNVLPPNSSVAKFVNSFGKSGFRDTIRSFTGKPGILPKLSKVGISVFCGFLVFLALKNFFRKEKGDKEEYSSLEKEMLRRKIKARMAKEKSTKGSVEVIQDSKEPGMVFTERPQLDKEELMDSIVKVKALNNNSIDFDGKIQEIRAMARRAREIEKTDGKRINGEGYESKKDEPNKKEVNSVEPTYFDVPQGDFSRIVSASSSVEKGHKENSDVSKLEVPNNDEGVAQGLEDKRSKLLDTEKLLEKKSVGAKSRIISSVKEAREYLHKKKIDKKEKNQEAEVSDFLEVPMVPKMATNGEKFDFSGSREPSRSKSSEDTNLGEKGNAFTKNADSKDEKEECVTGSDAKAGELGRANREKWMEDNFQEFEPIVEKIRGGFRKNYMVAREKVKEDINIVSELKMLELDENESEFEWMKDEKLREIVFQVRENELMGRDPFHLMDAEDKALFFKGLKEKVEKENEKLHALHEYLHSNIENLDYGADGISLYDPPEKIIPRWKGPTPATTMSQEFLDDYLDQRKALFAETLGNSNLIKTDPQKLPQETDEKVESGNLKSSRTVIEGSDGSTKPGKKSGKEFWQHTKKWSRGFIESYNAENDPETKAVMKDIGKDLDRWITEKEIQEAANIMDKVPDKGKIFIAEKINKLKREMELFGPQAVVSKYSEYGDEEEIDYYWWLDLPFLLCIELYIDGDGDQRIGFYSLEMASDLELDPKPHHIIAFEDAGDCKNLCYIIQAHLEMLGNGTAFVVPQSPKDTYQEARANGFNVTVIRKGEVKLDVDQTLEEVEEKIVEMGSKMYHDKIMKGRNVDIESIMKGVFGMKKPSKRRRSRKKLKKPSK
ncbi:uncharacterized protein LOC112529136 [Cynara cardunculus var. scolymus]|uniref:Embryo defective 1703 n=1 Tax=Cynara cardunculus var. scolymus TaxID=59895 RepID=A0A103XI53_CYNCS|nr:uncharacterized protein LOC112529136 [Cynara cardunculus var. scolymus]KVH91064.1 hypothetical protein Ccrd_006923 [Cynara cardunculus var. scolymus]